MKIIKTISEIRSIIKEQKSNNKRIGFVPTMGYLHEGHLSLIDEAKKQTDFVVLSIFVNPTQFSPNEDLDKYPRDLERDCQLAEEHKADIVFFPSVEEMYPKNYNTYVNVETLTNQLCGVTRPTHFRGVTTICKKFFNIIQPHKAFFGQKDAQQSLVIKRMVTDLNMELEIVVCPIVREKDGLAMSSRNVFLSEEERKQAICLSQSLNVAKTLFDQGERNTVQLINSMKELINKNSLAKIDYISCVDTDLIQPIEKIEGKALVALAVYFGKTRLIDNIILK